ncbi:Gfo/Idh/MocA family protein [Mycobacterium sp. WMMD1722]|uniref:Gfo/Idh/MocA family protein n=1 Tax=Mycobacterium sp. WMMD1722 TaxID=3404117 RepID=UPI003BF55B75
MISVLLIGAGAVVEEHYRGPLRRLERAKAIQVVGVADPNEARGRKIAGQYKRARAYPDCASAFRDRSFDLAIVASPPGLHADHACAAFAHGCHVLCEKPMTTTVTDADRMNAAAADAGRILGVAYPRRFYANFADVAALVASGELGDELEFTFREGNTYGWPAATDAAFRRDRSGGGALLDIGVHMLDQLSWIFGDPVVSRSFDDSLGDGVETNSLLMLEFPRAHGTMQVSWEYPLNNGLWIRGSSGEVVIEGDDLRSYRRKTPQGWSLVPARTSWPVDLALSGGKRIRPGNLRPCFDAELVAMLRCIHYGEPIPVTGVQAASVQAAIEHAYAHAEALDCSWLPEEERLAARAKHWKAGQH